MVSPTSLSSSLWHFLRQCVPNGPNFTLLILLSAQIFACDSFVPRVHVAKTPGSTQQYTTSLGTRTALKLSSEITITATTLVVSFGTWLYLDGADDRARKSLRDEEEARYQRYQNERAKLAYIEPKKFWTEEELKAYDGTQDENGPILMAADGLVFNVYKGRHFYGPGGEYHIFAGRDATRLLARTKVEEETEEEAQRPLSIGERAALAGWMYTIKGKYEIVGKLRDFDPNTTCMKS